MKKSQNYNEISKLSKNGRHTNPLTDIESRDKWWFCEGAWKCKQLVHLQWKIQ